MYSYMHVLLHYFNIHSSKTGGASQSISLSETGRLDDLFEFFPSKRDQCSTLAKSDCADVPVFGSTQLLTVKILS